MTALHNVTGTCDVTGLVTVKRDQWHTPHLAGRVTVGRDTRAETHHCDHDNTRVLAQCSVFVSDHTSLETVSIDQTLRSWQKDFQWTSPASLLSSDTLICFIVRTPLCSSPHNGMTVTALLSPAPPTIVIIHTPSQ